MATKKAAVSGLSDPAEVTKHELDFSEITPEAINAAFPDPSEEQLVAMQDGIRQLRGLTQKNLTTKQRWMTAMAIVSSVSSTLGIVLKATRA